MNAQLLKIWIDAKISHLEFIRDTGVGPSTPQSAHEQIKLLKEIVEDFNLTEVTEELFYHKNF